MRIVTTRLTATLASARAAHPLLPTNPILDRGVPPNMSSTIFHLLCVFARGGSVADEDTRVRGGRGAPAAARRVGFAAALLGGVTVLVSVVLGASPALADTCPNAQFRVGPSAHLPDCRAYEQVSPVDKAG